MSNIKNIDETTVQGFGREWRKFDQSELSDQDRDAIFEDYFHLISWDTFPVKSVGADVGCGSGRWAKMVAPRIGHLHLVDASELALNVARDNLSGQGNVEFHHASVDALPFADASLDFVYSLGVLHHVPDTSAALKSIAAKLKPGGVLLVYLYYAFDNRPWWFRVLWSISDMLRRIVCRMPFSLRYVVTQFIAFIVYWPLARLAACMEKMGMPVGNLPLTYYRDKAFYVMRTDALDRFGTLLEQRFTRVDIEWMLHLAGLVDIRFSESTPYWCAVARRPEIRS